ncbi:hypothetical protein [Stenotrophomonas indicatrix]|uniref:hypothetical protein n=1 Tax=Stenotrophomonas indicatrix TaxID=2045451 RepID=UPI0008B819CF|nr:hypothetical protein [Stenotrophomonas indicatrix]SET89732.1 hypothetical protein SAMN05720615_109134 [Stenotrophomonas indicatrix]
MKFTWKATGLLAVLVLVLVCGGLWLLDSYVEGDVDSLQSAHQADPLLQPYRGAMAGMKAQRDADALASMKKPPQQRKLTVREAFAGDPRLIALSVEEAAWMDRHHYPKAADLAAAESIDPRQLAGTRDPRLLTMAGSAFKKRGEYMLAMSQNFDAGAHGALYAYQQGAVAERALYEERFGPTNRDTAGVLRARLEVPLALGDHTVQYLMDTVMADVDAMASPKHVQIQSREFLRALAEDARLQGLPPPSVDPRPNAAQWNELYQLSRSGAADDLVTIYERQ